MKRFEAVLLTQVRVPYANDRWQVELPHEKAVHPAERELDRPEILSLKMLSQRSIDAAYEVLEGIAHAGQPGRSLGVVIQDRVEQLRNTPVRVRLHLVKDLWVDVTYVTVGRVLSKAAAQKHQEERCHEVVDSLHVATRWMANCPDVEDSLHAPVHHLVMEEGHPRGRARHVHQDLPQQILLLGRALLVRYVEVERNALRIFPSLALEAARPARRIRRHVAQDELPHQAPMLRRHSVPRQRA
mmetsp:Transcript_7429/g.28138  ORF Transcript_7429/g.28138 Transcript_7429/m.28138 type:complete len:242 (-) Transcript_7429:386-1111(-)